MGSNNQQPLTTDGSFIRIIDGIHIYQPLRSGRIWHKVNFLSEV